MEAVIDKDLASALLASSVHADPFMISTEVEEVAINFNKLNVQWLDSLAVAQGRPERAVRLFARADSMRRTIGDPRPANEQADVDRDLAAIRLQLDEAAMQAAEAAGRAMTPEEAVGLPGAKRGSKRIMPRFTSPIQLHAASGFIPAGIPLLQK